MGASIEVYDFDKVNMVNVGTQFYTRDDIGRLKVDALSDHGDAHSSPGQVIGISLKLTKDTNPEIYDCNILITALDSIAVRQELWDGIADGAWDHFIDMRMSAEFLTIYTVSTKDDMLKYTAQLSAIDPDDIPEIPCTMKATFYTANFAAGWVAVIIRRLLSEQKVPFMLSHDIMNVDIKTY